MKQWYLIRLVVMVALLTGAPSVHGQTRPLNDRVAAWQYTLVATDEQVPNSCLSTYVTEKVSCTDTHLLAKLVVGSGTGEKVVWTEKPEVVSVEDFPGGVEAIYKLDGREIRTRIMPVLQGCETGERQGAALFEVKSNPSGPLVVKCGESNEVVMAGRSALLRTPLAGREGDEATVQGGTGFLRSKNHSLIIAVKTTGGLIQRAGDQGGSILEVRFPQGEGTLVLGYSGQEEKAVELAKIEPAEAAMEVTSHYEQLLRSRIETPEKAMNDAFRGALITLEYDWLKPYGWIEAIHHWVCMWHMQVTGALAWVGQGDRVKESMLTHADHLFPNGAVPQFSPGGFLRRDFGGSNQFYAWQIGQYWNFSADREAAAQLYTALKRIVRQTFSECDEDGDLLLRWGAQIGNQEDFIHTPFNGTSPTVEGIQMLRTASNLAAALGYTDESISFALRAQKAAARLKEELWQADLGRFMYYKDPLGSIRPDGQYHTLIYPVIYDLLDPLDSWTSIRHLRDNLTGGNGAAYCSNNLPTHTEMTSGGQAGAAQQPWAAMGLAAVGLRNEAYRPLKTVAEWVMSENLRGTWMEVANEPVAAHFSPPAGLYMQSVIETLFGLRVKKPDGVLRVSPSFPDSWPSARLTLPEYSAQYEHDGNQLRYTVTSQEPLKRNICWSLPPCTIKDFRINGTQVKYSLIPGVGCVILSATSEAETTTSIDLGIHPHEYHVEMIESVAEGDPLEVKIEGLKILEVADRSKVLSDYSLGVDGTLRGTVREGQLAPYLSYGRLGLLNFSCRSLFLLCSAGEGSPFWVPLDVTLLPRFEVSAEESDKVGSGSLKVSLLVRNNTLTPLRGSSSVWMGGTSQELTVDIAPRSEKSYDVEINNSVLADLSPGENRGTLFVPEGKEIPFTLVLSGYHLPAFTGEGAGKRAIVPFPLPENLLKKDLDRPGIRSFRPYDWMGWDQYAPNLSSFVGQNTMTITDIPGLVFKLNGRNIVPLSSKSGTSSVTLDLFGTTLKKVYLLVIPYLDNHDTFIKVANAAIRTESGAVVNRDLFSPGDLDWGGGEKMLFVNWTWTKEEPRTNRFGLLPLLPPSSGEWEEGKPPAFPQLDFWASCLVRRVPSATMNVIEMELPEAVKVSSLTITVCGVDPALGLVAVSGEMSKEDPLYPFFERGETSALSRQPKTLFSLDHPGDLEGWRSEGDAFSLTAHPGLFQSPTLNSLVANGESAAGKAISPDFVIDSPFLTLDLQGGTSESDGRLTVLLMDSTTGETLHSVSPSGSHVPRQVKVTVAKFLGRKVHLEVVDENRRPSMAWIGISHVALTPR